MIVETRALERSFGDVTAVDGVDLVLVEGAVFGLLGPDGAGKSTLIRMLATVLRPSAGSATVFGHDVIDGARQITQRIGYMSQKFSMYPDLTIAENLEFFATVRGVPKPVRRSRASELLEGMGLAEFRGRQAGKLSGGMKQKLMLATTLMHAPDLLLLDEPTTGVDPVSRREFWRILAGLHREGRTVLVATPYMDEAERCTHIAFLKAGRVQQHGTPDEVKALVPGRLVEVTAPDPRAALATVAEVPGVVSAHLLGNLVRVLWDSPADPGPALGLPCRVVPIDMETVFAHLAERGAA